jgi:hypothetical protein
MIKHRYVRFFRFLALFLVLAVSVASPLGNVQAETPEDDPEMVLMDSSPPAFEEPPYQMTSEEGTRHIEVYINPEGSAYYHLVIFFSPDSITSTSTVGSSKLSTAWDVSPLSAEVLTCNFITMDLLSVNQAMVPPATNMDTSIRVDKSMSFLFIHIFLHDPSVSYLYDQCGSLSSTVCWLGPWGFLFLASIMGTISHIAPTTTKAIMP